MENFRPLPPIKKKRRKPRVKKEKEVEKGVRDYSNKNRLNLLNLKFTTISRRSAPDRIILMERGIAIFMELKRPGEVATESQLRYHNQLRGLGFHVYCIDNEEVGKELIRFWYEWSQGRETAFRSPWLSD